MNSRVIDMSVPTNLPTSISWRRVDRWPNQETADAYGHLPVVIQSPVLKPNDQHDRIFEFCAEHFGECGKIDSRWDLSQTLRMVDGGLQAGFIFALGFRDEADLAFFLIGFDRS